ncbi:MAG: hypothetical protein WC492_02475 [Candidatus Micrarchaeia archaeon]
MDSVSVVVPPKKGQLKTPAVIATDALTGIENLIFSCFEVVNITLSSAARDTTRLILFLMFVYFFKDPIFSENFMTIMLALVGFLLLEIFLSNKERFRSVSSTEALRKADFKEEVVIDTLENKEIDSDDLCGLMIELQKKKKMTHQVLITIVEQQTLSQESAKQIIDHDPPMSSIVTLLTRNHDLLDRNLTKQVLTKWGKYKEILSLTILTQSYGAEVAKELKLLDLENNKIESISNLRITTEIKNNIGLVAIVLSFGLAIYSLSYLNTLTELQYSIFLAMMIWGFAMIILQVLLTFLLNSYLRFRLWLFLKKVR